MAGLNTLLAKQLKRQRPKDTDGSGTFDVALSSDNMLSKIKYVLKTGIDPLDEVLGGLPFGRIVEMYGLESCGKTAMCIRSLIKAQIGEIYERAFDETTSKINLVKMDPKKIDVATVFIDNEQSVDEDAKLKVDGIELDCIIARCDTVDQLFKISDIVITKMAEKQAAEDELAKKEKRDPIIILTVIIVDTIAGTSSSQEMKQEWNKEDYQRQPKMLRQGFRRMSREINRHNVLMICTNQVSENFSKVKSRVKFSTPQAGDFTTFGGRAIKYYASIRVFMYQIQENYKLSASKFSQGFLIGFYTVKNRVVKPCRSARMVLLFEGGLSNDYSKFETLCFLGLVAYSASTKRYAIKFSKAGIVPTTIVAAPAKKSAGSRLEEDDDRGGRSDDPEIENKRAWSQFYVEHQVDCDKLWDVARELLFSDTIAADIEGADDEDDLDLDDDK
jgi:recombination protein RecA